MKTGKTVRIGVLDQGLRELDEVAGDRVREVLARTKTTFMIDGKELTPGQLLERLGFAREHLSARVFDLSGGQRRRLHLLLVLLAEPNVLILDEPTNDLDVDMLAVMEDVLDSWPGTLLVVSHDRYFLERVTDQQYAILDGRLRHLPGGVDEYLRLRAAGASSTAVAPAKGGAPDGNGRGGSAPAAPKLAGAELRAAQKELTATERRLDRLAGQVATAHKNLADHDPADYEGVLRITKAVGDLEAEIVALEERWLELSEQAG